MNDMISQSIYQAECDVLIAEANYLLKELEYSNSFIMEEDQTVKKENLIVRIWHAILGFFKMIGDAIDRGLKRLKQWKEIRGNTFVQDPEYKSIWLKQDENHNLLYVKFPKIRPTPDHLSDYQKIMYQLNFLIYGIYENADSFDYSTHNSMDNVIQLLDFTFKNNPNKTIKDRKLIKILDQQSRMIQQVMGDSVTIWDNYKKQMLECIEKDYEQYYLKIKDPQSVLQAHDQTFKLVAELSKYKASSILNHEIQDRTNEALLKSLLNFSKTLAQYITKITDFTSSTTAVLRTEISNYNLWKKYHKEGSL